MSYIINLKNPAETLSGATRYIASDIKGKKFLQLHFIDSVVFVPLKRVIKITQSLTKT